MEIQVVVFWIMMPYSDVIGYQHFGGPCCFHLHPEVHDLFGESRVTALVNIRMILN
jgi:hypothetical protein